MLNVLGALKHSLAGKTVQDEARALAMPVTADKTAGPPFGRPAVVDGDQAVMLNVLGASVVPAAHG
jgi:hypothetical protein